VESIGVFELLDDFQPREFTAPQNVEASAESQ